MDELEHKRRHVIARDAEVADRLLRVARPTSDPAREAALLDRIVAAAERTPRLAVVSSGPTVERATDRVAVQTAVLVPHPTRAFSGRRDVWSAASVLAASLMIGFVAGQMSTPFAAVQRVADVSGITLSNGNELASVLAAAEDDD